MAAGALPAGAIAHRHGRRAAFLSGTGCGVLAGLLAALAVISASFWLFCIATFFGGAYAAVVLTFRFAATDSAPPEQRPRALSAVMAGGVLAGVVGPQLVNWTMDLWAPHLFALTFLAQAGVAFLSGMILYGVRLPVAPAGRSGGRSLAEIARQPRFLAAVTCGTVSYVLMNMVMTSAPLAMRFCGISQVNSDFGIQWHVIAMYAPSFITGRLIARFGAPRVTAVGLAMIACSAAVGLGGTSIAHFWLTLILLGSGWNFGFLGASALVLECHRAEERTKVQSFNDFVVFGMMVIGSFISGGILTAYGWDAICWLMLPVIAIGCLALLRTRPARLVESVGRA